MHRAMPLNHFMITTSSLYSYGGTTSYRCFVDGMDWLCLPILLG